MDENLIKAFIAADPEDWEAARQEALRRMKMTNLDDGTGTSNADTVQRIGSRTNGTAGDGTGVAPHAPTGKTILDASTAETARRQALAAAVQSAVGAHWAPARSVPERSDGDPITDPMVSSEYSQRSQRPAPRPAPKAPAVKSLPPEAVISEETVVYAQAFNATGGPDDEPITYEVAREKVIEQYRTGRRTYSANRATMDAARAREKSAPIAQYAAANTPEALERRRLRADAARELCLKERAAGREMDYAEALRRVS